MSQQAFNFLADLHIKLAEFETGLCVPTTQDFAKLRVSLRDAMMALKTPEDILCRAEDEAIDRFAREGT